MHASVGRRKGFEPSCSVVTHVAMNDFDLINDHTVLLQGRDKSKICPGGFSTNSRSIHGGGIRNNTGYIDSRSTINVSCGKRNFYPQTQKNDITAPMSAEARLLSADEYIGIGDVSDISSSECNAMRTQDGHQNKGKDLFFCDWPELGGLEDFDTNLRNFAPTFEIESNYFEDPIWSSICSPGVQLVPSSWHFENPNMSTVSNESATNPILKSSVSVPDTTSTEPVFLDQINMTNPMDIHQPSSNEGRETPLNCEAHACSSSGEIGHFSQHSDADLFCPFENVASTARISSCEGLESIVCSSITCNDEIVSSSTCSGPDLVPAYVPLNKSHDPLHRTPDMILDGMAENPLEMYFPPLTTYEQPELLMNDTSTQMHQFPEDFAIDDVLNSSGMQFCSKGMTSAESCENPCASLILKSVPVKNLGFQKLQEGMNKLDVGTKTCIRDALYRLANSIEQKHRVNQLTSDRAVESSGANRFRSSRWTEMQTSPLDRSVAQLLLQKSFYRKTGLPNPPCQANHGT